MIDLNTCEVSLLLNPPPHPQSICLPSIIVIERIYEKILSLNKTLNNPVLTGLMPIYLLSVVLSKCPKGYKERIVRVRYDAVTSDNSTSQGEWKICRIIGYSPKS